MARRRRRRGLRGLGKLRVGMGKDLIPPAVGLGLTAGTAFAIRAVVTPTPGSPAALMYRIAPWIGMGAGILGGLAIGVLGTRSQAATTVGTAVVTGAALYGMERFNAYKGLIAGTPVPTATPGEMAGFRGLGAVVPEYPNRAFGTQGLGAIVMERLNGNQQNQGADIALRGVVNTNAFGSRVAG